MPVVPRQPPSHNYIDTTLFNDLVALYPAVLRLVYTDKASKKKTVKASDVKKEVEEFIELDRWRYEELPKSLARRKKQEPTEKFEKLAEGEPRMSDEEFNERFAKNCVWGLEKEELERLVTWKLKHGTFRPTLLPLIRSNDAFDIKGKTLYGFGTLEHNNFNITQVEPLRSLTSLKGVGPATASLLLSVAFPEEAPFFGDEVFAWLCEKKEEKRKIKYDLKEYRELWRKVQAFKEHLSDMGIKEPRADEVDKVGFVCGHWDVLERVEGVTIHRPSSEAASTKADDQQDQKDQEAADSKAGGAMNNDAEVEHGKEGKGKARSKVARKRKKTSQPQIEAVEDDGMKKSKRTKT